MKQQYYDEMLASLPREKLLGASILITGANGMIASALAETLILMNRRMDLNMKLFLLCRGREKAEERFRAYLDDPAVNFVIQDVSEPLECDIAFRYIIHAASSAYPGAFNTVPVDVMKANFIGTLNMLTYAARFPDTRVLFVSSSEIYGENFDGVPVFTEDTMGKVDPARFRACYPESKRAAETLCMSFKKQYDVDVVAVRPAYIYGRAIIAENTRADAYFLRQVMNGQDIVMYSTGEQVRSYCYVDDCISGMLFVLLKGESGEVYNIGDPDCIVTLHDYAEMLCRIGGTRLLYQPETKPEGQVFLQTTRLVLSVDKLRGLGWRPMYTLEEGMHDILDEADGK